METREMPPGDAGVRAFLEEHGAATVARRGALLDATTRPALVAVDPAGGPAGGPTGGPTGGPIAGIAGVLTYDIVGPECEILTLHAATRWGGAGTALVEAVHGVAARAGCHTLWVLTTNDNVDGLRFYQRRGFALSALRPGAVDESRRTLKPQIPATGLHGIPLRDEIELSQPVRAPAGPAAEGPAAAGPGSTPRTS